MRLWIYAIGHMRGTPEGQLCEDFCDRARKLGRNMGFSAVVLEELSVSKQRSAEASLDHQRAMFQSMFASMPDPIVLSDMSRQVQLINPAFTRVFGFGPNEVMGKPTTPFYASESDVWHPA